MGSLAMRRDGRVQETNAIGRNAEWTVGHVGRDRICGPGICDSTGCGGGDTRFLSTHYGNSGTAVEIDFGIVSCQTVHTPDFLKVFQAQVTLKHELLLRLQLHD